MIVNGINSENEIKKYNIFLAILRVYLSFNVINCHCLCSPNILTNKKIMNKYIIRIIRNNLHVPMFLIMSFYFSQKSFLSKNIDKIKRRFERLLIPYFIWPIIIWIINNFLYYIFKLNFKITINDLKIQLMTGHCFMTVLWFQYNLIFATLLIIIIIFLSLNYYISIMFNLCIIAFFFQYSNLSYNIFSRYGYFKQYTFGRFIEIIPFCFIGFIIPSFNKYIIYIIKIVTSYTSGIYFLHTNVHRWTKTGIRLIKNGTISGCIIIYLISYFISLLGAKILGKNKYSCLFK